MRVSGTELYQARSVGWQKKQVEQNQEHDRNLCTNKGCLTWEMSETWAAPCLDFRFTRSLGSGLVGQAVGLSRYLLQTAKICSIQQWPLHKQNAEKYIKFQQVPTSKKLQILSSDGTDIADTHSMPTTRASSEQIEVKDEREATPSSHGSHRVWWMRIGSQRMAFGYLEIREDTC